MRDTVLFLCPHNAAKSVIAVAYFRRLATRAGLDLVADSAGTEPDDAVWPSVIELLREDGLEADDRKPRHVTPGDLARARLVVSMGCDLPGDPAGDPQGGPPDEAGLPRRVERWDDLPLASEHLARSRDAIKEKVEDLVVRLRSAPPAEPKPS